MDVDDNNRRILSALENMMLEPPPERELPREWCVKCNRIIETASCEQAFYLDDEIYCEDCIDEHVDNIRYNARQDYLRRVQQ